MLKEESGVESFLSQLEENNIIWKELTSESGKKIIVAPIITDYEDFSQFKEAIDRNNIGAFKRYFKTKYNYKFENIDESSVLFSIIDKQSKKILLRSLIKSFSKGLWLWISFDKNIFRDLIIGKLIQYLNGIYFGSIDPEILQRFIDIHVSEKSLNVISQRSPFVLAKRIKLPSKIEDEYGSEESYQDYYSEREISIHITATKRWLKKKLKEAKEFAKSELVSVHFKVYSPNPGVEISLVADEIGTIEDRSHIERVYSPLVVAEPLKNILNNIQTKRAIFQANLPEIYEKNGITYYKSFGKCFVFEVKLDFDNREAVEYDSHFIEKFLLYGGKEGWDFFYGNLMERKGKAFIAEIFDQKFGGDLLIKLEIEYDILTLYVKPSGWTNENTLFLLYTVLQRKLAWNIELKTIDKFPYEID